MFSTTYKNKMGVIRTPSKLFNAHSLQ